MKRYVTLNGLVLVFAALVMMVFAVTVNAEEDDTSYLPTINDGRINSFDIDAPVAIYDLYSYPYADDVNAGVLDRVEFWGLDGQKVLEVERAQIIDAQASAGTSVLVASGSGYSLYKEADGSLTAVVGAYVFNWMPSL